MLFCSLVVQGRGADVTNKAGEVTRFPMTASVTYLAHNNLDGKYFSQIEVGDEIIVLDDDNTTAFRYKVTEVISGKASDPLSVYTNIWIDNEWMTPAQVYERVGMLDPSKLILQTCIAADGNSSWGRLWVVAVEVPGHIVYNYH